MTKIRDLKTSRAIVADYRAAMLARKASAAGCTVEELLARGQRDAELNRRVFEIKMDGGSAWDTLERHAWSQGRVWCVL